MLSTITMAPAAWASSQTAAMSTSVCMGFEGLSKNTACAGVARAGAHWSRSSPSTKSVVMP